MTKVAIYCRVDHGSVAYGQFAIEQQKKQLEQYAKNNGMRIAGCYTDCGYSGSDLDRPGLVKLQKAWRAGRFDAVVVVKKDRLYHGILQNAPEWPFKVISLTEREASHEKKNTVHLIVNGSIVEAVFSHEANPEVFDNVKHILINSMFQRAG